jgi:hypothetical protein
MISYENFMYSYPVECSQNDKNIYTYHVESNPIYSNSV